MSETKDSKKPPFDRSATHGATEHGAAGLGEDLREAVTRATDRTEEELQRLIHFLNDEVVPDVRRHSSAALRAAAERLRALAQTMDDRRP